MIKNNWSCEILTNFFLAEEIFKLIERLSMINNEEKLLMIYISLHPSSSLFQTEKMLENISILKNRYHINFACSLVSTKENIEISNQNNLENKIKKLNPMWFSYIPQI